jgi:DNA-binding MarR family transcriptional regulator
MSPVPPAVPGEGAPRPESDPDDVLTAIYALQDAEALFRARLRKKLGIGASELAAVQFLARLESRDMTGRPVDVAAHLGISTSAVSPVVVRLERRGFVVRRPDPDDGRGVLLALTPAAHAAVLAAAGRGRAAALKDVAALPDRDARRFVALLTGLTTGYTAGAAPDPSTPCGAS